MSDQPSQFFSPHEPPPDFTPAPADEVLAQRISKLAQFAARNGPGFVELMVAKQSGNPEYAFLSGGEGSSYWRWILYCTMYNLPSGEQPFVKGQGWTCKAFRITIIFLLLVLACSRSMVYYLFTCLPRYHEWVRDSALMLSVIA